VPALTLPSLLQPFTPFLPIALLLTVYPQQTFTQVTPFYLSEQVNSFLIFCLSANKEVLPSIFVFLRTPATPVQTAVTHPFPPPTPTIPPFSKASYHTISSMSFPPLLFHFVSAKKMPFTTFAK
jgi:hypothetical protein